MPRPSRPQPSRNSTFAPCTCGAASGICFAARRFVLSRGELLQVIGPNGVGKTSLLRCVAGLLPTESGEIVWRGRQRTRVSRRLSPAARVPRSRQCAQARSHGARESAVQRRAAPASHAAELRDTLTRLQIAQCADLPARALSAGQKRRVAIAPHPADARRRCGFSTSRSRISMSAGIALFEECMAEHLRTGGLILTAAHQLLLQGRPDVRTLELH